MILSVTPGLKTGMGSTVTNSAELTWEEFVALPLREDDPAIEKGEHPCIYPCRFEHGERSEENVRDLWAARIDVDQRHVPEDELLAALAPYQCVAWTSFSSTPDALRWAVFVRLVATPTKAQYKALVDDLVARIPGASTSQSDMSRARVAPVDRPGFRRFSVRGNPLALPLVEEPVARAPEPNPLWERNDRIDMQAAQELKAATFPVGDEYELCNLLGRVFVSVGHSFEDAVALVNEDTSRSVEQRIGEVARRKAVPGEKHLATMWAQAGKWLSLLGVVPWGAALVGRMKDGARLPGAIIPAPTGGRRRTDPKHEYTVKPGDRANGKPDTDVSMATVTAILCSHPDWLGVLQYDEFSDRLRAVNPPIALDAERDTFSDIDALKLQVWFEVKQSIVITKEKAFSAACLAAQRYRYHPVREYLLGLPKSDVRVLDDLATRIFGAQHPLENDFLRKFLIGAVRRVLVPGTKVDTMLILFGDLGHKKSTFAKDLFGAAWMAEDISVDLKSKDALATLEGKWCIEMAEVDKMLGGKASMSVFKSFLSRTVDRYRGAYLKATLDRPRSCVFIGTTNHEDLISDSVGDRRLHIIRTLQKADLEWLRAHRDEVWSAALQLAMTDEPHWYDDETPLAELKDAYVKRDPWHETIEDYCKGKKRVRPEEIFLAKFAGPAGSIANFDVTAEERIKTTLSRLKCKSKSYTENGESKRAYHTPDALRCKQEVTPPFKPPFIPRPN